MQMTAEQYAQDISKKVERLLEFLSGEVLTVSDAGLLLCNTLQGLIITIEGQPRRDATLEELTLMFIKACREEQKVMQ